MPRTFLILIFLLIHASLSAQSLQTGRWTGHLTPMNHPEMHLPMTYDVSHRAGALHVELAQPDGEALSAYDIQTGADSLFFTFNEPEADIPLRCTFNRQASGHYIGPCTDPDGKYATFVMRAPANEAEQRYRSVEGTLLGAASVRLKTLITSEGAVSSRFEGEVELNQGNRVRLQVPGRFFDRSFQAHLNSDGTQMKGGTQDSTFTEPTPPGLHEALIIGLMRMGLLHNLARLTGTAVPDHGGGDVQEWVQVSGFSDAGMKDIDGTSATGVGFNIFVAGQPAGGATLWIDSQKNVPLLREQTVQFESGEMRVVERYPEFEIELGS